MASSSNNTEDQHEKSEAMETEPVNQMPIIEQATGSNLELMGLNYDALVKICESVTEFKDQLSFARSSEVIRQIYINHIWSRGQPICELSIVNRWCYVSDTATEYRFYLHAMRTRFTYFYACGFNQMKTRLAGFLHLFRRFGIYELPKVKMCIIKGRSGVIESDIDELSEMLPNLMVIVLYQVPVKGQYLSQLTNLKELFLIEVPVEGELLIKVLETLKLLRILDARSCTKLRMREMKSESLEVVRLHVHTIRDIVMQVLNLPKLKTLELRYCKPKLRRPEDYHRRPYSFLLPTILTYKASQITSIIVNNIIMKMPADWDNQLDTINLCNLEKLIFNNWQHDEILMARHLTNKSKLKTLGCGNWSKLSVKLITDILTSFNNLKMFELSEFSLYHPILRQIVEKMKYEGRIEPLNIWNWSRVRNILSNNQIEYWNQQKLLNLYLNSEKFDVREFRRDLWGFEMDFDRTL